MQLGSQAANPRVRGGVRWPQPCLRHARPRHGRSAQPPGSQRRSSRRRGGAPRSLQKNPWLDGWHHKDTPHGDGELGSMNGLGALTRHAAAVMRLEGQHTGTSRSLAARLDVVGPSQESIQGAREGEDGRGVLTSGRRCSHGRLGVIVHVDVVVVPGGGVPSAPVPWSRTAPAPMARRLPSFRSRLRPTSGPRSS
jgi:hypothetical protein